MGLWICKSKECKFILYRLTFELEIIYIFTDLIGLEEIRTTGNVCLLDLCI